MKQGHDQIKQDGLDHEETSDNRAVSFITLVVLLCLAKVTGFDLLYLATLAASSWTIYEGYKGEVREWTRELAAPDYKKLHANGGAGDEENDEESEVLPKYIDKLGLASDDALSDNHRGEEAAAGIAQLFEDQSAEETDVEKEVTANDGAGNEDTEEEEGFTLPLRDIIFLFLLNPVDVDALGVDLIPPLALDHSSLL